MPLNGSGTYNPPNPPVFPAVAGTTIKASDFNAIMNDMASAITAMIARDGQSTITGVLQWAQPAANLAALGGVALTGAQTIAGVKTFSSAPLSAVGAVADNELTRLTEVKAAINSAVPPGTISPQARLSAASRWLLVDGKTIGNAGSGATARADADTWLCYEQVWAFPAASVPIFDSTGAPSTRGASALADFNAGKRLALFTPDGGAFLRMWAPTQTVDAGRAAGSTQESQNKSHQHAYDRPSIAGGTQGAGSNSSLPVVNGGGLTGAEGGDEARPYNLAMPHYIFLGLV